MKDIPRFAVMFVLAVSSVAKMRTGHDDSLLLPFSVFWGFAVLELIGALALAASRFEGVVLGCSFLLGCGGLLLVAMAPDQSCGCLGSNAEMPTALRFAMALTLASSALLAFSGARKAAYRRPEPLTEGETA